MFSSRGLALYELLCDPVFCVTECGKQTDKTVFHLQSLIEGTLYYQLEDEEMSIQVSLYFKEDNGGEG